MIHLNKQAIRCFVLLLLSIGFHIPAYAAYKITIVIDDIGDNWPNGLRTVELPGQVSCAFLPHTPHSKKLATLAHNAGKTVMLHAPMSNYHGLKLGPGALTHQMDQHEFLKVLRSDIEAIPYIEGVNNHMGSHLTTLKNYMQWTMGEVAKHQLFFIDSKTTAQSVAAQTARTQGIPTLVRDIFLDNNRSIRQIGQQFGKALRLARKKGHVVIIGHPYPETLDYLERVLPSLPILGYQLVRPTHLIGANHDSKESARIASTGL